MSEPEALRKAISALEAQRATLGDAVVDAAIAALRRQFAGAPPPSRKERKQVTILFADLVGFTTLAERMDPEEVHEVLGAYFNLWKTAISRHGGVVEKFIGDAIVVVFGLPLAREDTPRQAVHTALEVREELKRLNRTLKRRHGFHLAMRVGIHSGSVLVYYEEYAGKTTFTVIGDAVNLAARLQQVAPVGGILISRETFRQVRGLFGVIPQEPFLVKGRTRPVQTYLVRGPRQATFWPADRGLEEMETPMVGREPELALLQETFQAVASGKSRFLTIVGEAGVGKTRLLWEFERRLLALSTPIHICRARASPETTSIPYALPHHLFSLQFDILESDDVATVQAKFLRGMGPFLPAERALLVGQLAGFDFSAVPSVQALLGNPSLSRQALADLTLFFRSLAASAPVALFLEDIHWADNSSLDLFFHLPTELSAFPLLIVASSRPNLFERRPDLLAEGEGRHILHLDPLSLHDCRTLAGEILRRVEDLPLHLPDLLARRSGGNPFFLEELVHMLIAEGVIVPDAGRWCILPGHLQERRVPSSLTALLEARLDALPPAERTLLQRASVVGQRFWDGSLVALGGEEPDPVSLLEDLVVRGMVLKEERSAFSGTREYTFRHALLQEVCYETVLLRQRRLYHRRVAKWLEGQVGERQWEYAGRIGEHYERAGEMERAAYWLQQAGERALETSAFPEAVSALERALALVSSTVSPRRWRKVERQAALSVHLGSAWERWGKCAEAEKYLRAGLALAQEVGQRKVEAEAFNGLAQVAIRWGNYQEAYRLGERALALAREVGERPTEAVALRRLGTAAFYQGDFQVARRCLEEALALEERQENRWGMAACLNALGHVEFVQADLALAFSLHERALALFREIGDRQGIVTCLTSLGNIVFQQGNYSMGIDYYENALTTSREIDDRQGIAFALLGLGWANLWLEEYSRSARYSEESLTLFRELGDRQAVSSCLNNLGHAAAGMGQEERAKRYYLEALAEAHEIEALPILLETIAGLAGVLARAGRHRRAAELLGLALYHPATFPDVAKVAGPALSFLRAHMSAEALETAMEEGRLLDLEDTVRALLTD